MSSFYSLSNNLYLLDVIQRRKVAENRNLFSDGKKQIGTIESMIFEIFWIHKEGAPQEASQQEPIILSRIGC